jgi:hypothetical protein
MASNSRTHSAHSAALAHSTHQASPLPTASSSSKSKTACGRPLQPPSTPFNPLQPPSTTFNPPQPPSTPFIPAFLFAPSSSSAMPLIHTVRFVGSPKSAMVFRASISCWIFNPPSATSPAVCSNRSTTSDSAPSLGFNVHGQSPIVSCPFTPSPFRYPRRPVLAASMSLFSPLPPPPAAGDSPEADESVLEEDSKEECDHLSAALVTGHIAALRMLHVPFRCDCETRAGRYCLLNSCIY